MNLGQSRKQTVLLVEDDAMLRSILAQEAAQHEARGLHRILYQFSPGDYPQAGEIWNGQHPEDGSELEVTVGGRKGLRPRISSQSRSSLRPLDQT